MNQLLDDAKAFLLCGELKSEAAGTVFVVGKQHFVARSKRKAVRNRVRGKSRVGHKNNLCRVGTKILGDLVPGFREQAREFALQKPYWLPLQFPLPSLVLVEHRPGAGSKRAMIQEDDIGIEEEIGHKGNAAYVSNSNTCNGEKLPT